MGETSGSLPQYVIHENNQDQLLRQIAFSQKGARRRLLSNSLREGLPMRNDKAAWRRQRAESRQVDAETPDTDPCIQSSRQLAGMATIQPMWVASGLPTIRPLVPVNTTALLGSDSLILPL